MHRIDIPSQTDSRPVATLSLAVFLLFVSIARLPQLVGTGGLLVTMGFAGIFLWGSLYQRESTLYGLPWLIVALTGIWIIGALHLVFTPSIDSVIRLPAFIGLLVVTILYLPQMFSLHEFCSAIAVVSALLVLVGMIPVIGGPSHLGPFDLTVWVATNDLLPFIGYPIRSIFENPNVLGMVTTFGAVGALGAFVNSRQPVYLLFFGVSTFGVLAAQHRTGVLTLCAVSLIFGAFMVSGRSGVRAVTIFGCISGSIGLLAVFGIIPAPDTVTSMTLNNRVGLWQGSIVALIESPITGYGFGNVNRAIAAHVPSSFSGSSPHNSFLQMALRTGLFGGLAYLSIFALMLHRLINSIDRPKDLSVLALLVAGIVIQMFESSTIFGTKPESILIAMSVGYANFWILAKTDSINGHSGTESESEDQHHDSSGTV